MTSLREIRTRLDRLAANVPSTTTGRPMTSEEAIRGAAALVEEMKAAGVVVPDDDEPLTMEAEGTLIARALAEAAIELGQVRP